jgi:hypothetical protein
MTTPTIKPIDITSDLSAQPIGASTYAQSCGFRHGREWKRLAGVSEASLRVR